MRCIECVSRNDWHWLGGVSIVLWDIERGEEEKFVEWKGDWFFLVCVVCMTRGDVCVCVCVF